MKKSVILYAIFVMIILCFGIFIIGLNQEAERASSPDIALIKAIDSTYTFSGEQITVFSSLIGKITVNSSIIPESPRDIQIYRGYFREGDQVEVLGKGPIMSEISNPVPEERAPEVAEEILEQYGGLPADAQLLDNFVWYEEVYNGTTHEIIEKNPLNTFVSWYRDIDGMQIEGGSDIIQVTMGENGTLLHLNKRWRTYEPLGNVSIISATKAIDKLAAGEVLNPISAQVSDVEIYNIHLSYYVKEIDEPEVTLEPIWVFYGNASGTYVPFFVYARQFANFTATPTFGKTPLTVTFTDTSDASPNEWYWEFGDGTNTTEQNPVHTYSTPGNYTVSLNATNDDGTGSITKPDYITVTNLPPTTITTQPTTTVTTTITTTVTTVPTTTQPTPTKTHAPLSPVVPVVGIMIIGLYTLSRQKRDR